MKRLLILALLLFTACAHTSPKKEEETSAPTGLEVIAQQVSFCYKVCTGLGVKTYQIEGITLVQCECQDGPRVFLKRDLGCTKPEEPVSK